MKFHSLLLIFSFSVISFNSRGNENAVLSVSKDVIARIAFDSFKPHEAYPAGVPKSFDWAKNPRLGAGNIPGNFKAATGWGQTFYVDGATSETARLAVRNFQTLLCVEMPAGKQWIQLQSGELDGRQFRADFAGDISTPPIFSEYTATQATVSFLPGSAFHFWPKTGRFELPVGAICGFLVLLEAKQLRGKPNTLLIGLGADYWTNTHSKWDNYRTNRDVAIGRLRLVSSDWSWFGLTTASGDALNSLLQLGYVLPTRTTTKSNSKLDAENPKYQ